MGGSALANAGYGRRRILHDPTWHHGGDIGAVTASAQAMWLLVAWGYWVDQHRAPADHQLFSQPA